MKWPLLLLVGITALPGAALALQAPPKEAAPKADLSTPENTLRTFTAAITRADVLGATACVRGTIEPQKLKEWIDDWKKPASKPPILTFIDLKVTPSASGDQANVEFTLLVTDPNGAPPPADFKETVKMVKTGESWQIVPLTPAELREIDKNPGDPHMVAMLSTMMAHPDLFIRARAAARQTVCRSNLKQLATGALMVANDHGNRLALRADGLRAALLPLVASQALFQCPEHPQDVNAYSLNVHLQGVAMKKIRNPQRTVLLYEGKKGALDFRHAGKACVAFASGHTALVDAAAAKKLLWKPQ